MRVHCTNSWGCWMMLMWKLELQQTVHLPGEHPSPVVHNCLLYALPCCCREAKHAYSVPSEFLQDLILIPGLLLAQRICWLDPQAKAAFCVSVPLLSAKWQLVFRVYWDWRKGLCTAHLCNSQTFGLEDLQWELFCTISSEVPLKSYKAVIDLPIAMGLTNISLPIPTENVVWFRFKELIM